MNAVKLTVDMLLLPFDFSNRIVFKNRPEMPENPSKLPCKQYPHASIQQQNGESKCCSDREDGEEMYLRYLLGHCICANCMQCVSFMLECTSVDPWGGSLTDPNWNAYRWLVYAEENAGTHGFDSKDYANLVAYVKDQLDKRIQTHERLLVDGDRDEDHDDDDEMGDDGEPGDNPSWAVLLSDSQLIEELNYRIKKSILDDLLSKAAHNPDLQKKCSSATEKQVILELQAMTGLTAAIASFDLSPIPLIPVCLQSLHSWLEQHDGQTQIILPTRAPQTQMSASSVFWK